MKNKIKPFITVLMAVILLLLSVSLKTCFDKIKEDKYRKELYTVINKKDVLNFIEAYGYVCEDILEDKKKIPAVFNQVYSEYNEIQKEQGFDLSKYKGKEVLLYKAKIKDGENNGYAVVVVCENLVIGCSVHSDLNGGYIKRLLN